MRDDWDEVRFALLCAVSTSDASACDASTWRALELAVVSAYDRPVPAYPIYRELRTFALVRWPQLARILDSDTDATASLDDVVQALERIIDIRDRGVSDALETEMALLSELLNNTHQQ